MRAYKHVRTRNIIAKLLYTLHMLATSMRKYSAALSSKAGLVDETFTALRLIADGKNEEALRIAFLEEDVLGKDTHENRRAIWTRLRQRFLSDWDRAKILAKMVAGESNYDSARLFIYYAFCLSEYILYDAVIQQAYTRYVEGFTGVEISDLQAWLDSSQNEHPEIKDWSPQTRKKVLSNILSVLRDYGLMSGVTHKKFERVFVPTSLAGYILYSLKDRLEQFGPLTVISSPDWRLFFLDEGDVVSLLKELTSAGHCVFQKQGEVMILDLKWQNLEEYIEAITGKI